MEYLNAYIILIILVKFCFTYLIVYAFYLEYLIKKEPDNKSYQTSLKIFNTLKHQVEFIFTIMIAILMIILFYPYYKKQIVINHETRFILYLFGILLIITANWLNFFNL
jgi:hypothetical protein